MVGREVLEVLREQFGIINKSQIKNPLGCKRIFFIGNSKDEGRCITYGKR